MIPYSTQTIGRDDINSVLGILKSSWLTQGPAIHEFEKNLCSYTGAKYAVAVANGTAGLHLACLAAGVKKGYEVLTSPITFVASANCALYCDAKPVFIDIEKDTTNISVELVEKYLKKAPKAPKVLIPVHFAGHACAMKEVAKLAKKYKLTVIEDAAHALGGKYQSSMVGGNQFSDMSILSFHPVKSITTGEGGAILTNNKKFYEKLLLLRSHGITRDAGKFQSKSPDRSGPWFYEMQELGFNYRITDLQCALGVSQLKKLDGFIEKRREVAQAYLKAFNGNGWFDLPVEKSYASSAWHLFVIRLKKKYQSKRLKIFAHLRNKGLGVNVHYIPVYQQPFYQRLGYKQNLCPNAEEYYRSAISIPIYPKMSKSDVGYVVETLRGAFQ